jgi:hypothetical protein
VSTEALIAEARKAILFELFCVYGEGHETQQAPIEARVPDGGPSLMFPSGDIYGIVGEGPNASVLRLSGWPVCQWTLYKHGRIERQWYDAHGDPQWN